MRVSTIRSVDPEVGGDSRSSTKSLSTVKEVLISWIEHILRCKGFTTFRDQIIEGAGIGHKFDLIAEQEVVPNLEIRLGIIVHGTSQVSVDDIEKLIAWREELPIDKVAIVTLGNVDPKALELAMRYGIDIVIPEEGFFSRLSSAVEGGYELSKLCRYVVPKLSIDDVIKYVINRFKHGFFRRVKAELERVALTYLPLIVAHVEVSKAGSISEEIELIEGEVVIDGILGYIVKRENGRLVLYEELGSIIKDVPRNAIEVLQILSEELSTEIAVLVTKLGTTLSRLKPVLEVLKDKGFVDIYGDLVEFKGIDSRVFTNLESLISNYGAKVKLGEPLSSEGKVKLGVKVSIPKLEELLRSLRCDIKELYILYYPFYTVFLREVRNGERRERVVIVDGITGRECEGMGRVFSELDIIEFIKENSIRK